MNTPQQNKSVLDLTKEVNRMAELDGLKHPAQLDLKIEMTRRDNYVNLLNSYYLGRDDEAVRRTGSGLQRAVVRSFFAGAFMGFLVGGLVVVTIINNYR